MIAVAKINSKYVIIFISVEAKKAKTLNNIALGKEKASQEIVDLRTKIQLAKETLVKFKEKFAEAQAESMADS